MDRATSQVDWDDTKESTWPNSEDVCVALQMSSATLRREVTAGKWPHCRKRQRGDGLKPERIFPPAEVRSRIPAPPPAAPAGELTRYGQSAQSAHGEQMSGLVAAPAIPLEAIVAIAERAAAIVLSAPPPEEPELWCGLDEARRITGLTRTLLKKLALAGVNGAIFDHGYKFRRDVLPALDVRMVLIPKPKGGANARSATR